MTRLSVLMPTFNRADVLGRTLEAYLAQLGSDDELLVVDDGSTDATPSVLAEFAGRDAARVRSWRQENAGPAAARNRALAKARGEIVLFAGDDVLPAPGTIGAHLAAQAGLGLTRAAVLGPIRWHPDLPTNAFLEWLERGGVQFAFDGQRDGDQLPPTMWYSSNVSIPRSALPAGETFDPQFRRACWEDIDLGHRLAAAGVGLRFAERALAWHWHPMTLDSARRRAGRVGYYRAMFERKHGLRVAPRSAVIERLKRIGAPLLRAVPVRPFRDLGFRWSLAWEDQAGYQRFLDGAGEP